MRSDVCCHCLLIGPIHPHLILEFSKQLNPSLPWTCMCVVPLPGMLSPLRRPLPSHPSGYSLNWASPQQSFLRTQCGQSTICNYFLFVLICSLSSWRQVISLLGALQQSTTDRIASATKTYCLTVLEAGSPISRYRQGWFLLRIMREGSVPGLSPWLVDDLLLPVASHCFSSMDVCVQISPFSMNTSHIGSGPTLMTSS